MDRLRDQKTENFEGSPRRDNRNAAKRLQDQQVFVAADDQINGNCGCARKDMQIVAVAEFRRGYTWWRYNFVA